jgi:hypothetical protein
MQRPMFYGSIVSGIIAVVVGVNHQNVPIAVTVIGFGFALLHAVTTAVFLRIAHSPFRWLILLWTIPVLLIALLDIDVLRIAWRFRHEET